MGKVRNSVFAVLLLVSMSACGQAVGAPPVSAPPTTMPTVWEPTSEAPEPTTCPASGIHYGAGVIEAALGHRAVVLTLANCGQAPQEINGYPDVRVLGPWRQPLDVRVNHDSSYMATDPGPAKVTLVTGEKLLSVVSWSATVMDGDTVTGAALSVTTVPGEAPQILTVKTDLGTTGEVDVTAWAAKIAQ
ncbi:DUF4232 domain-containing protein [Amycolatopsis sp.]|jgi:hypothetical protein|uniref:DUF4232 domain-containing protein n=1 Tax=Amycolatopsis sp. TaxID=37632 RepID=UPI002E07D976|nr:DUF4232 domain-containing protein [Amycolatopsis sp.]